MKSIILFCVFLSNMVYSQIIKDSILGKPRYVKEYVLFLNNSGPYTFLKSDSEYGHAIIMTPKNLRESMRSSWFETDFCRYTNNETYYDKNRNITKEIWYYESGEIVDDYNYTYDSVGRKINENSGNKHAARNIQYFYEGASNKLKFVKYSLKWKDEPTKTYFGNRETYTPFTITKYDSVSKTDSIFTVTDFIRKKVGENSYQDAKDSIFRKKLTRVNLYDENFQIKESKYFDHKTDYNNKKLFQSGFTKFEYDSLGRTTKETQIRDDKYHYFILEENGKYREELKDGEYPSVSSVEYEFDKNGNIIKKTRIYQGSITNQAQFVLDKNQIQKLYYIDSWGKKNEELVPNNVLFKYKYDQHNNWIECIKNVNGQDLYLWKREIKYY
ncbi:hypothetical protein [Chryseobacterium koreense]|nr:hypothetical protein [Chryseobacterium koreense]MBB5332052.1 hypothetical protein [Chryseobacterium koreense]